MDIIFREKQDKEDITPEGVTPTNAAPKARGVEKTVSSGYDVADILESQPTLDELSKCLQWLLRPTSSDERFSIQLPSPCSSRILKILTTTTIANFWRPLQSSPQFPNTRQDLIRCLRSVPGMGALVLSLNSLSRHDNGGLGGSEDLGRPGTEISLLVDTRAVLGEVLAGPGTVNEILSILLPANDGHSLKESLWKQAVSLLGGGRMLSNLGKSDALIRGSGIDSIDGSLGSGEAYAAWLGRNIRYAIGEAEDVTEAKLSAIADLFRKAYSLGFPSTLVEECFHGSLNGEERAAHAELRLLGSLKPLEQKRVVYTLLTLVSSPTYLDARRNAVTGLAALLRHWEESDIDMSPILMEWVTGPDRGRTLANIRVHRAVIAALALLSENMLKLCEGIMSTFGDKLYIRNAPILQQEMQTRDLLLVIGHIYAERPSSIQQFAKSSVYINAISNRIASSSIRPQFLGMVLATAISGLVDEPSSRIKFTGMLSNTDHEEFIVLLKDIDSIGVLEDLKPSHGKGPSIEILPLDSRNSLASHNPTGSKKALVQDVDSSSESEEESDPTDVRRKNPTPPVYIRELLDGLRDYDDFYRFKVNLLAAPDLIQRKASFGTEVQEHIEDLAIALIGAKNASNDEALATAQLEAMVALILARPEKMGPWLATLAFSGDYSIAQRLAVLSSLALSARKLAGYKCDGKPDREFQTISQANTSSKHLPQWLKSFSAPEQLLITPIESITSQMNKDMIQPMVASTADKLAGPNSLKVRTFSSRLNHDRKTKRIIRNELSKIVGNSFFFPLTDRFRLEMETRMGVSAFCTPILLSHYLKTLALLMNAAGPNALSLQALTADLFGLCLMPRLKSIALEHLPVLDSLFFCLLTILDVNSVAEKDLIVHHGSEILEIKSWVEMVLGHTDSGSSESAQIHTLAAGVLVRCSEIIDRYQQDFVAKLAEFV